MKLRLALTIVSLLLGTGALVGARAAPATRAAAPRYSFRLLQPLAHVGPDESVARSVNAFGTAAGGSSFDATNDHATLWSRGGPPVDLGSVAGIPYSYVRSINAFGHASGAAVSAGSRAHALRWAGSSPVDLTPTLNRAYGESINDFDVVGGFAESPPGSGKDVALEFPRTGPYIQVGDAYAGAYGINDAGVLTGYSSPAPRGGQAAIWHGRNRTDLGFLPGQTYSEGFAINLFGDVVGDSGTTAPSFHGYAFLWRNGAMMEIPDLPGASFTSPEDMNNEDDLVGYYGIRSTERAWLWHRGRVIDMNTLLPAGSPWTLTVSSGINDLGQMAGNAQRGTILRGFLLSPPPRIEAANVLAVAKRVEPRRRAFQRHVRSALGGFMHRRNLHRGCRSLKALARFVARSRGLTAGERVTLRADVLGLALQAGRCGGPTHL